MKIQISAKEFLILALVINAFLICTHLVLQNYAFTHELGNLEKDLIQRFDMNEEISIPTWFDQILLFVGSLIASAIGYIKRQKKEKYSTHWIVLGFIFLYLSVDEGSSLHETLMLPVGNLLNVQSGFLSFAWVIPFGILVVLFAATYLKFWLNLPLQIRALMAFAGLCFVGGALGMEMVSAEYASNYGHANYTYLVLGAIEEGLEGLGSSLFIYTLMLYAAKHLGLMPIKFNK